MEQVNQTEESTLSPALASLMAQLSMPHQYAAIMADSVLSVNSQCPVTVHRIAL